MKITRIFRVVHRDLGFFVVGITLVYAISGILLNHLDKKDPAFRTESKTVQLSENLSEKQLSESWIADKKLPALKRVMRIDDNHLRLFLDGGIGVYTVSNGSASYEKHEKRVFIYWINRLHYNKVKHWSPVADFYAGSLILLAVTGLLMMKGKRGLAGSGKWYLIIGLLIPILYGLLFLR